MTIEDQESRRAIVRRRALANALLVLLDVARRSAGRLAVEAAGMDAFCLRFRDVRTLVRRANGFAFAKRNFVVMVALPALWPFDRNDAPVPVVVEPDDARHPNSDGRLVCVDTKGITPERLVDLLYDVIRLKARRTEDCVDAAAAAYVREHLPDGPADPRPLVPTAPAPAEEVPAAEAGDAGVVDVAVGVLDVVVPPIAAPVVLRLARRAGDPVDAARAAYLRAAGARVQGGVPTWAGGPALAITETPADGSRLHAEIRELARSLDALDEPHIAASFLELRGRSEEHATRVPADPAGTPSPREERQ